MALTTSSTVPPGELEERLEAVATAHRRLEGPGIPGVVDDVVVDGRRHVVFDSDAVLDGEGLIAHLDGAQRRVSHAVAAAIIESIAATLLSAHGSPRAADGAPNVLGVLEPRNVLITPSGGIQLIGFGATSFVRELGCRIPLAPELVTGSNLTEKCDAFALVCFSRSMIRHAQLTPRMKRAHEGHAGRVEQRIRQLMQVGNGLVWGAPPSLRPSMETGLEMWRALWRLGGVVPDHAALRVLLAEVAAATDPVPSLPSSVRVRMAHDASWVEDPSGALIDLRGRPVARRMLAALLTARASGRSLDVWTLAEVGWPGERATPQSAVNRVYVTLSRLRALGLRDVLERVDDGYRFAANVDLDVV